MSFTDTVKTTESGAILYDTAIINQISDAAFSAKSWPTVERVTGAYRSAGRGNTLYVSDGSNDYVLKRYLRGGVIGRVVREHYCWLGEKHTRAFAEWRLLSKLVDMGLPVPRPAAARYRRLGPVYSADLLTLRIPGIRSLADRIAARQGGEYFWQRVGTGLQRFHQSGVCHADLNAYNVQIDEQGILWLLDFDRGRLLPPGTWQQKNLARLHRSLQKLKGADRQFGYSEASWEQLLEGYFSASRSA